MLTVPELIGLEKGDVVETMPLLAGVTQEPVVLRVKEADHTEGQVKFVTTWHGVTLGAWTAIVDGEDVRWEL